MGFVSPFGWGINIPYYNQVIIIASEKKGAPLPYYRTYRSILTRIGGERGDNFSPVRFRSRPVSREAGCFRAPRALCLCGGLWSRASISAHTLVWGQTTRNYRSMIYSGNDGSSSGVKLSTPAGRENKNMAALFFFLLGDSVNTRAHSRKRDGYAFSFGFFPAMLTLVVIFFLCCFLCG